MKWNREEIALGTLFGCSYLAFLGPFVLLTGAVCPILWALSGAGFSKLFRRLGCPLILCISLAVALKSWFPLMSILPLFGVLSLGYGIPQKK